MRVTRTYSSCVAIGEIDVLSNVGRVWVQDYSFTSRVPLPPKVAEAFGCSARAFETMEAASEWLFENGAIISQLQVFKRWTNLQPVAQG